MGELSVTDDGDPALEGDSSSPGEVARLVSDGEVPEFKMAPLLSEFEAVF